MKRTFYKGLLALGAAFSLLFASCSDLSTEDESTNTNQQAIAEAGLVPVRFAVEDSSARTASPHLLEGNYNDYSWFLYAKLTSEITENEDLAVETNFKRGWAIGAYASPYSAMTSDTIGLAAGTYNFVLVAKSRNNTSGTQYATVYTGVCENKEIPANATTATAAVTVTFDMYLTGFDTTVTGNGDVELTLTYSSNDVSAVSATMYAYDDSNGDIITESSSTGYVAPVTLNQSGNKYSASGVASGAYVAVFTFTDKDSNVLGKWEEYVNVTAGSTSKGSVNVKSLDDIYTISYVPLPATNVDYKRTFTRHSGDVTLLASYQMDETLQAFCGWYTNSSFTGEPVTKITASSNRNNITLYGKYVLASEIPQIATVTITAPNTLDVGSTVTAVAKDSAGVEVTTPTRTYQWYAAESNEEGATLTAIPGATSSTYKVTGSELNKYLKVKVTQSYAVTTESANATNEKRLYYIVEENSAAKESGFTAKVEKTDLDLSKVFVQYSGYVLVGDKPKQENLILSGSLSDSHGNAIRDFSGDFSQYESLYYTTAMTVTITAEGYNITDDATKPVTVPVQYAKPSGVVLKTTNASDDDDWSNSAWAGQIMFDLPEDSSEYANWEYATVTSSTDEVSDSDWTDITTAAFPQRVGGKVTTPGGIWVRVKSTGSSSDSNLVYASDPVYIEVKDENIAGKSTTEKGKAVLLTGSEVNALFLENFKTATKFVYTTDTAPADAVTISQTGSYTESDKSYDYTEVKAWVESKTIFVNASGYDGTKTAETDTRIKLDADCSGLFANLTKLKNVDLSAFDTSDVTNMSAMFQNCAALASITFGDNINTSKVTNMSSMFDGTALTSVDLSKFDTSKVENMSNMFANSAFTSLALSLDTTAAKNMESMFSGCSDLETLSFSGSFTASATENMSSMFKDCESLEKLDISTFNTENVTKLASMFNGCSTLETVKFGTNFNTATVTDMSYMFAKMTSLVDVDVSGFVVTAVTTMDYMFSGDKALSKIYAGADTDWTVVADGTTRSGTGMFAECSKLTGGVGTKWASTKSGLSYAKTDTSDVAGYFTAK